MRRPRRHVRSTAFILLVLVTIGAGLAGATRGYKAIRSAETAAKLCPSVVEASLRLDQLTRRLVQRGLRREGFDPGPATGRFSGTTRVAIERWQRAEGEPQSGYLNRPQVDQLGAAGAFPQAQSFGYFMVLPSILAALALNRLLSGAALLLRRRRDVTCYTLHVVWAVLLCALLIQYWHTTALCAQRQVAETLVKYAAFFIFPAGIYLAYTVLMPRDVPPRTKCWPKSSLRDYYYEHAALFFTVCSIGMASELVFSQWLQCNAPDLVGENLMRGSGLCTVLTLASTNCVTVNDRNRARIHWVGTVYAVVLFLAFVLVFRTGVSEWAKLWGLLKLVGVG